MNENIYKCYKCGNKFHSDKEPKKIGENSSFVGYICKKCFEKHKQEILKTYVCSNCNYSLKEVNPYNVKTNVDPDKDLWVKMDYICPKCSSHVSIKRKIGGIGHLVINSVMLERYKDESIKKIYALYKKGFKIIEKRLQMEKNQDKYTIILAKGNEVKELEVSEVSDEFSYFWAQIQFVYDKNLRRIATLIEPNKYWSRTVIPQKIDDALIEISGYTFTKFEILDLPKEKTQNPLFRFNISLADEKNKKFLKVDFREPLSFYIENQLIFKGYITTLMKGYDLLEVICQGLSGELIADKINISIRSKKERYLEFMAFLLDYFEKPYHIDGLDTEERGYDVIIPIEGLNISDKLQIGDCFILDCLPTNDFLKENNFSQKGNFAILSLNRVNFYDALIDGIKYIQGAIDLINFRIKIPTFLGYYHYFDQRVNIKLRNIAYIKDKKHEIELITKLPLNRTPEYERDVLIQEFFEPVLEIGDNIIKPNEELTNEKEKLLWILHYLISAEEKTNRIEAFLDLCIALEFILNRFGEKIKKRFSKNEINEIRNYCNNFLPIKKEELERLVEDGKIKDNDYEIKKNRYELIHKRIIQLIESNFNQPSINDQMRAVLEKYRLELTEKENSIFKDARQRRNKIIHGKKIVKPTNEEYNILSKIIYFIIRNALIENLE